MNILLIASNSRFGDKDAGFTHPYNLSKGFSTLGHNVTAVFKPSGDSPVSFEKDGIRICLYDWSARISNIHRFMLNFIKEFNYILKIRNDIDLIYERYELSRFSTGFISRLLKIPCAIEINTPVLDVRFSKKSFTSRVLKKIDQFHLNRFDFVITQTKNLAAIIKQRYKGKIFIIPNGADAELFSQRDGKFQDEIIEKYGLKNKKIIGYLGAMMPWHGISDLLYAYQRISSGSFTTVLFIIGGTCEELIKIGGAPVEELILQNRIVAAGKVYFDLVPYYLNICDVLVAPFNTKLDTDRKDLYERFGMWWCPVKLFEYLATGKPIVTTDLNEIRFYLNRNAYYHAEGDRPDLAKAIISALKEGENPELQIRRKNHFKANFTWEIQAKKIIDLFEKNIS